MRKMITILMMMLVSSLSLLAQEHMTFAGIPLTGSISSFQQKLISKGFKHNAEASKLVSVGSRIFDGTFAGHKATIFVYYDERTKTVYRAKAVYTELSEDLCNQFYDEIKSSLAVKYDGEETGTEESDKDGIDRAIFRVFPSNSNGDKYGEIDLYQAKDDSYINYPNIYNLHIDYIDLVNFFAHQGNISDDL